MYVRSFMGGLRRLSRPCVWFILVPVSSSYFSVAECECGDVA